MIEEIDTNNAFEDKSIPDGKYDFRIDDIRKAKMLYVFVLSYNNGMVGEQPFFANTMGPLLKTLGCKENLPGVYAFNSDELIGKKFSATVYREADKKDKTIIRQRMKAFDELPF